MIVAIKGTLRISGICRSISSVEFCLESSKTFTNQSINHFIASNGVQLDLKIKVKQLWTL
jgi:hypothetical protein